MLKKSFTHFLQLLKERKFSDIYRISSYYFLDKVVRNILIILIKIKGKIFHPHTVHRCPFCRNSFPYFYPIVSGDHISFNVQCPYCKSYERHRMQWLYYHQETDILRPQTQISILHCAPEELFFLPFSQNKQIDYYPVDKWEGYSVCGQRMRDYVDLTHLPYENQKFDYILCNHVLEHIPQEQLALSELKRVLKENGTAFINVPIDDSLEKTLEDPAINSDILRLKYYGQCDHVRKYGRDYQKRLESAGFSVKCITASNFFSQEDIRTYGLLPNDQIYSCKKGPTK